MPSTSETAPRPPAAPATGSGAPSAASLRGRGYRWLVLGLSGNAALEAVDRLRQDPGWHARWPVVLGSAPNLLAVAAVAGTLAGLALVVPPERLARWSASRRVLGSIAFAVAGLLLWEALQPLTRRGIFDWHDVVATLAAGAVLAVVAVSGPSEAP